MKLLKILWVTFIFPVFAVGVVACGYHKTQNSGGLKLCKHQYALCTSATCIPQPNAPDKALCFCDVEEGASLSTISCDQLQPSSDKNGIRTLYSSFSLKQFREGKMSMKCPGGTPWTWCLNKVCTLDPSNPKKAICVCDVKRSGEWLTLGGNCDTSTCATGYWSGATLDDLEEANAVFTQALGIESPVKWCPISS